MDQENSSASSFEDLTHLNENEIKEAKEQGFIGEEVEQKTDTNSGDSSFMDVLGNGQLTKQILKSGEEGNRPMHMDWCKVSFLGELDEDGTVVEEAKNMELHLGDNEVVQGLDMAIALMNLGEKAEVKVNARFAYGEPGLKSDDDTDNTIIVPPNATVTYTVELHDFKPVDPEEPRSFEERNRVGTRKKERGNYWFKRNDFNLAIQLYRKAIEYFDENVDGAEASPATTLTSAEIQELLEQRMVVYNNLAAAQTKIDALEAAMKSVETVLLCQPENVKALYRKGKILDAKGETNDAILIFQKAATLDPENRSFQNELSKLILKRSREQRNERNLYQKMLGQAQKMEQKKAPVVKQVPTESNWTWYYLFGSILIGVAGVAFYRYKFD